MICMEMTYGDVLEPYSYLTRWSMHMTGCMDHWGKDLHGDDKLALSLATS